MHVLDNPVWHALTGPQETVAEGTPLASRYDPRFALFSALPDEPSPDAWAALRALVGPGGLAILFRPAVTAPAGWQEVFRLPTLQMVATAVEAAPATGAVELGPDDVPEMLDLVDRTHPGPFEPRTIELGTYVGIRDGGELVAMAGERMRLAAHTEISAVCTAPTHQRQGLASALVSDLAGRIGARGDVPILHVVSTNESAIRVYEALGFTVSRELEVSGFSVPSG